MLSNAGFASNNKCNFWQGQKRMNALDIIKGFVDFLKGKKTYIVGILMIVLGYLNGDQKMILEGIGLITLRAGISGVNK